MRYRLDERNLGGSMTPRLNPHFGPAGPGMGHLGAKHLPNPMVKNTELGSVPEQDARRHARIGLPDRFKR